MRAKLVGTRTTSYSVPNFHGGNGLGRVPQAVGTARPLTPSSSSALSEAGIFGPNSCMQRTPQLISDAPIRLPGRSAFIFPRLHYPSDRLRYFFQVQLEVDSLPKSFSVLFPLRPSITSLQHRHQQSCPFSVVFCFDSSSSTSTKSVSSVGCLQQHRHRHETDLP